MKSQTTGRELNEIQGDAALQLIANKNFGLEEGEFVKMLANMQAGEDALFERVFLSQFEESIKFLMQRYGIQRGLAYDVTMDALLKFRKRLLAGKISYGNMRFLFTRMAGQFLADRAKHTSVSLSTSRNNNIDEEKIDDQILDALDIAWKVLCADCNRILKQYYYRKIALKDLAVRYNKSEAALRKQKQRCLEKLKAAFTKSYSV